MKSLLLVAALIATTVAMSVHKMAPLKYQDSKAAIPGSYIVRLDSALTEEAIHHHHATIGQLMSQHDSEENSVGHKYKIVMKGYSAKMSDEVRDKIRLMPEVESMEQDQVAQATACNDPSTYPPAGNCWGLSRISNRVIPQVYDTYAYDYGTCNGAGVIAYIVDTGVDSTRERFTDRVIMGADCYNSAPCDNTSPAFDDNGHGTHVAATIMADEFGIARSSVAIGVKVLSSFGSGSYAQVVAGVEWSVGHFQQARREQRDVQSVMNLSLGGPRSDDLNRAVENAKDQGIHVVVAAGNEYGSDACFVSPAGAGVIAVGATDDDDDVAIFSNLGECIEIFAPGVNVWSDTPTGPQYFSGTSMAAPHVAGVLARLLTVDQDCYSGFSCTDKSPAAMEECLVDAATENVLDIPDGVRTVNKLLYMSCDGAK